MNKLLLVGLLTGFLSASCDRPRITTQYLGEDIARKNLKEALADTTDILYKGKVLIDDEKTAIKFAEVIMFKVYGQQKIEDERPYEVHYIDGYWIIRGTLPIGYDGGTFQIIFSAKDGQIIRSTHYK